MQINKVPNYRLLLLLESGANREGETGSSYPKNLFELSQKIRWTGNKFVRNLDMSIVDQILKNKNLIT